jgi:hypothetical protein
MFDYLSQETQSKDHITDRMADAENYRLVKQCKSEQTPLTNQLLATLGDVLVNVGTRLQDQRAEKIVYSLETR